MNILVIEDDPNHLDLLTEVIKYSGHTPYKATNTKQAHTIILNNNISLIVTDIYLAGDNSLNFIEKIQKDNIKIPFIILSGSTDINDKQTAENLNALSFLSKPVDPEVLLKLISNIMYEK